MIAEEIEVAAASGNGQRLFRFIRKTGGRRTTVSEVVFDRNGELMIHGKQNRVDRLAGHFKHQFSWPHANVFRPMSIVANPCEMSVDPQTEARVKSNILMLKRGKAAGRNELRSILFNLCGEALMKSTASLLHDIWNKECTPVSWSESLIAPTFTNGTQSDHYNYHAINSIPTANKVSFDNVTPSNTGSRQQHPQAVHRSSSRSSKRRSDIHSFADARNVPHKPPNYDRSFT